MSTSSLPVHLENKMTTRIQLLRLLLPQYSCHSPFCSEGLLEQRRLMRSLAGPREISLYLRRPERRISSCRTSPARGVSVAQALTTNSKTLRLSLSSTAGHRREATGADFYPCSPSRYQRGSARLLSTKLPGYPSTSAAEEPRAAENPPEAHVSMPLEAAGDPESSRGEAAIRFDLSRIPGTENAPDGLFALVFTCCKCNTRSAKKFSKVAYNKGVVIIRCPGCKNLHLVADRLKWFGEEESDVETILATKGETVIKSLTQAHLLDIEGMEDKSPSLG